MAIAAGVDIDAVRSWSVGKYNRWIAFLNYRSEKEAEALKEASKQT